MKIRYPSLIAFLMLSSFIASAQAPKYSNEFLSIGVGARGLAMSNSIIASVDDVTAGYWNPAGLVNIKSDIQLGAMHAEYFAGIANYDFGAIGINIDTNQALAFSLIRFGVDDIPNTTELIDAQGNIDYDRITSFSAADYGFLISYARKIKPNLSVGGNVKIVHRKVGEFAKAWGFGLDAGVQYKRGNWNFAAMARDVTSTFNAWSYSLDQTTIDVFNATGNEIPENSLEITLPRLLLGVARNFELGKKFDLITELDLDLTTDGKRNVLIKTNPVSVDPHFGFELGFQNIVYLRGGVGNIQTVTEIPGSNKTTFQPNFGLGIKLQRIALDYALTDIGDQSAALYSNLFSLKFDIYKNEL